MHTTKYITSSPQNCQSHEEQGENLRNCQRPEETKETWKLHTMLYPGWDPRTEKVHKGKAGKS